MSIDWRASRILQYFGLHTFIDEIFDDDCVIILHQGRICADGSVAQVVAQSGAEDIAGAFNKIAAEVAV